MTNKYSSTLTAKIDEIRALIEARRVGLFTIWEKMHALEESQEWRQAGVTTFRQFALATFGIRSSQYEDYHVAHQFLSHDEMTKVGHGAVKTIVKFARIHGDKAAKLVPDLYMVTLRSVEKFRDEHGYHPSKAAQKALTKNAAKQIGFPFDDEKTSPKDRYNALVEALEQVAQMGAYGTPSERIGEFAEEALRAAGHEPKVRHPATKVA